MAAPLEFLSFEADPYRRRLYRRLMIFGCLILTLLFTGAGITSIWRGFIPWAWVWILPIWLGFVWFSPYILKMCGDVKPVWLVRRSEALDRLRRIDETRTDEEIIRDWYFTSGQFNQWIDSKKVLRSWHLKP